MQKRQLNMVKKQFSLTTPALKWLTIEAQHLGVCSSELLRRIVDAAREKAPRR